MRAGGLKHRVEIQSNIEVVDEYGARVKTWATTITTKADILFKDGSSAMKHGEVFTDYKVDFRVRKYHEVDETMRIMYKGDIYRIEAVLPNFEKNMKLIKTTKYNE